MGKGVRVKGEEYGGKVMGKGLRVGTGRRDKSGKRGRVKGGIKEEGYMRGRTKGWGKS